MAWFTQAHCITKQNELLAIGQSTPKEERSPRFFLLRGK